MLDRPSLCVYVAYHDSAPHPVPGQDPFVAVCNPRADGRRPPGFEHYTDRPGAPRADLYSELRVQDHLERVASADYVGLAHYRRLFVTRAFPRRFSPWTYDLSAWDWAQVDRYGATKTALLAAIGNRDWCTAPRYDVRWAGHGSLWEQFASYHPVDLLMALADSLALVHSRARLADYLRAETSFVPFNMFLARADAVRAYGQWLWPVLAECQRQVGVPADPYQRRYLGFLAERLHGYWLATTAPRLRVGEVPVAVVCPGGLTSSADASTLARSGTAAPAVGRQGWTQEVLRRLPWSTRVLANRAWRRTTSGRR